MRGLTLLVATILTFGYGFAAQAAMTVDASTGTLRGSCTVKRTATSFFLTPLMR